MYVYYHISRYDILYENVCRWKVMRYKLYYGYVVTYVTSINIPIHRFPFVSTNINYSKNEKIKVFVEKSLKILYLYHSIKDVHIIRIKYKE